MLLLLSVRSESSLFDHETKNHASWVLDCQDRRVYLKSDRVVIHEDTISVVTDSGEKTPLSELFVDAQGIYTRIESLNMSELTTVWNIVWCKTCKAYRSVNINGHCVVCGNIP